MNDPAQGAADPAEGRKPSPILNYPAEGQRFAGAVDYLAPTAGLRGWVVEMDAPGHPVALGVRCDGRLLATAYAMMDRPDIDEVLGRLTQCGFLIGWSRFDAEALAELARRLPDEVLEVFILETGQPVPMWCPPVSVAQAHELLQAAPQGDLQPVFREVADYREAWESGLFDATWYVARHGERIPAGLPPLLHYLREGEAAGLRPSFYFDPATYSREADLPGGAAGALLHYIRGGFRAGISPSVHFAERWYRQTYRVEADQPALAHYLARRGTHAPNPWFDPAYYAEASGVGADVDPYEHFVTQGLPAGLAPAARFEAARAASQPMAPAATLFLRALRGEADQGRPMPPWQPARPASAPAVPSQFSRAPAGPDVPPAGAREKTAPPPPSPTPAVPIAARASGGGSPGPITALRAPVRTAPIASPATAAAPPAPPAPPAPAGREEEDLPQAVSLGYARTEAALAALPEEARARLLRRAERLMREEDPRRADAALIVAVARMMARDPVAAAEAAAQFLTAIGDATSPEIEDIEGRLLAANHQLYQGRRGAEAGEVYRLLYARGRRDYLVVLRLLEAAVDRRDARAAAPYAEAFEAGFPSATDPWGVMVLARYHTLAGDMERALALLAAVPPFPQTEAAAEAVLLSVMMEAGGLEAAAERLRAHPPNASQELFNARFRIAVRKLDAEGVLALLDEERAAKLPNWQLVEAMFLLSTPGKLSVHPQNRVTRRLYGAIEQRGFEDHGLVQARLHYLLMTRRWEDLSALFEALEVTPFATHRETLLRRLDFLCQTERIEAAQQLYNAHFRGTELNKWESLTIMRLFSELKRWEEAAELLLGHVARGFDFGAASHAAMRVVRRAAIHEAVLDVIAKSAAPREPGLQEFVERVQEDLLIVQRASALALRPEAPGRGFRYRSNWILAPGEHAPDEHDEHCLLLCTNQRYFLSLLTFLCSFFGQSPQTGAQVFVFLDRDVPRRWHGTVAMVAARFGRSVTLITESEFMAENVEHRVEYGFFAGGSNLSRSAYFRLYATRYLLERHRFQRALYVDTDIICRGDLTELFNLPLGDKPIAAATED